MFPGAGAEVHYNEAGEPLGWDYPAGNDTYYCDMCGHCHFGDCESDLDDLDDHRCEDCGELENSFTGDCTCGEEDEDAERSE